ncbi:hypothetical protein CLOM_g6569 [Closterium sp. NIES-68]|nr:hypothetical protein CLOM_g6569 [Closterium sp. NIES-68]GJP75725.1 hypothetical protein CLOP_g6132 [Closterium sp. NIES-67]
MVVRETPPLEQVRRLGAELLASRQHVNNAVALLRLAAHREAAVASEAVSVLQTFFAHLLRSDELVLHPTPGQHAAKRGSGASGEEGEERAAEEVYARWVRARYGEYTGALKSRLRDAESSEASKRIAVEHLMELARLEKKGTIAGATINKILIPLVEGEALDASVLTKLASFFTYADVRRHVYSAVEQLCASMPAAPGNAAAAAAAAAAAGDDDGDGDAGAAKRDAMCLNILDVLLAMPMPPSPKPGGKRLLAMVGQGEQGEEDPLLANWALPRAPTTGRAAGAEQRSEGGKQSIGGKRARQAQQQGSRKRAAGSRREEEREDAREQGGAEGEERRAAVVGKERRALGGAWLGLLALPLPRDAFRKVVGGLHTLIPHLPNPLLLSDFLTACYSQGGACAVAALAALFELMTEHRLEYPHFYPRLYCMLDAGMFRATHRAKFFELLDRCLASPLLPAYMAAAFTKRLFRLSLSAPPSGAIVVVALAHNLLRRHPVINTLVHRTAPPEAFHDSSSEDEGEEEEMHGGERGKAGEEGETGQGEKAGDGKGEESNDGRKEGSAGEEGDGRRDRQGEGGGERGDAAQGAGVEGSRGGWRGGRDPFDEDAADLMAARALDSSVWEIEALQRHYCPAVSRFVASLEKDLSERSSTVEVNVGDFSHTSYGTIMADELGRRVKAVPLAFFEHTPTTLFPVSSPSSSGPTALLQSSSFPGWKLF